jgi:hypothetical protein
MKTSPYGVKSSNVTDSRMTIVFTLIGGDSAATQGHNSVDSGNHGSSALEAYNTQVLLLTVNIGASTS